MGEALARLAMNYKTRTAVVFALRGELGAGKTTWVKGFLRGMGVRRRVISPTFILWRRFALRNKKPANVYHLDAYRLKHSREVEKLGFGEIIANPRNVVVVEWADKIRRLIPPSATWIEFRHGTVKNERWIKVSKINHRCTAIFCKCGKGATSQNKQ